MDELWLNRGSQAATAMTFMNSLALAAAGVRRSCRLPVRVSRSLRLPDSTKQSRTCDGAAYHLPVLPIVLSAHQARLWEKQIGEDHSFG
ncbi:unnamed protein product [Urochloa humidicola]